MSVVFNFIHADEMVKAELSLFLHECGVRLDPYVCDFVEARVNGKIVGCAGLDGDIVKCVAVSQEYRGQGILTGLMDHVFSLAIRRGVSDLMLCTKPENVPLFQDCGFTKLVSYKDHIALMSSAPCRLQDFCAELAELPMPHGTRGAIVMKADPFTLGHRYLVKQALSQCNELIVFVVSEEKGIFSCEERLALVKAGTADFDGVRVLLSGRFMISRATFPAYFLRDDSMQDEFHDVLDVLLFRNFIAPAGHISMRFVGTEPLDAVTCAYNRHLEKFLSSPSEFPAVSFVEIARLSLKGDVVSASRVRRSLLGGNLDGISELVPSATLAALKNRLEQNGGCNE